VAGIILALLAPLLARLLSAGEPLTGILRICALIVPFSVVNLVLIKAVVAFQRIGYRVAVAQVASPLVRLVLTAVLIAAGMRANGAIWAYAASEVVSCVALLLILQTRVFPVLGKGQTAGDFDFQPFLSYSLPLFLSGMVVIVLYNTDTYMVKYYLDFDQVGLYGAAARLAALIAIGTELLNPMFLSITTGAFAQGRIEQVTGTFNSNNRWLLYISLPVVCMLLLFAGEGMTLVWGAEFAAGASVLAILAAGRLIYYLSSTSALLLSMYGRSRTILTLNLVAAAANLLLNWLLIPRYGIAGAALATSLALSVCSVITIETARAVHRGGCLMVYFPRMIAAAALACLPALAIGRTALPGLPKVLVAGVLLLAVFLVLLKVFGVYDDEDRKIWRQIRNRIGLGNEEPV
jgi:O-antigen/teichoic acid export membrane protein